MNVLISSTAIVFAISTYVLAYKVLFDDLTDLRKSVLRLAISAIIDEFFPGFGWPMSGMIRAFVWVFSGLFVGAVVTALLRYAVS